MITIENIADFILKYSKTPFRKEQLIDVIKKHLSYKTCCFLVDKNDVVAFCRWNIDGETAYIMDAVVDPKLRNTKKLVEMLKIGLAMWPNVKQLSFKRYITGNTIKALPVESLLK